MSKVTLKAHEIIKTNMLTVEEDVTSFASGDTVVIPFTGKSPVIRLTASEAGNVTFAPGNGIQGVMPLTVALKANKEGYIMLDAGFFENVSGAEKGNVIMTPAVAGTCSVLYTA